MDAFLFLLGVLKSSWKKKCFFERSFNCFLPFLKFGLWAVEIVIFNCLPKMEIKKKCFTNKLDISVALGSAGLDFHTHTDFVLDFQLNSIQLIILNTQDSYYCTTDLFSQQ